MGHLVAAPDKFRGTATAAEIAGAAAAAARLAGWTADEVPMADGGEGTLDVVGGEIRHTIVTGPLGEPVDAEWRMIAQTAGVGLGQSTAVIEMARAAGRALLASPTGDEPLRASTAGVGQLVLAAVDCGARRIVVAVGGSATTDGGSGAVEAIGSPDRLGGADLVVACDVQTRFLDAARVFGPQKGATSDQVDVLSRRLEDLARHYQRRFAVDVTAIAGGGAAGGLAGGLAALGARLVAGFTLVADLVGLSSRLDGADLVVTGEGHLDLASLDGKVVGGVVAAASGVSDHPGRSGRSGLPGRSGQSGRPGRPGRGRGVPVLCVVGDADPAAVERLSSREVPVEVVSLTDLAGASAARNETVALVADVVRRHLARHRAGD